jgi:HlyD family secretion protein
MTRTAQVILSLVLLGGLGAGGAYLAGVQLPGLPARDTAAATPATETAPAAEDVAEAEMVEVQPPAITVSTATQVDLSQRIIATGLVAAVEEVQVQPLIEGQPIESLLADEGDIVTEGQVLATLSNSTLELQMGQFVAQRASTAAAIAQAEASLIEATASAAEAERVATRNAQLVTQGTIAQAQADQTEAAAEAARARVRAAEQGIAAARAQAELVEAQIASLDLQMERTEVRAPFGGVIVARNAQVGAIASAATGPMFTIVRDSALEMQAEVSEQDLLRLAPDQPVELTGVGLEGTIAGTVRLVEPTIDTQSRLGHVRITINQPELVRVGMFLSADILVQQAETLAVPVTAVSATGGAPTVMRVVDGVAERVNVTLGIRDGDMVGITQGLSEGDLVVTKAAAFVRPGDRITPVPDTATEQAEG